MTDDISKVDKPAPNWCPRCHKRPDDVTFCTHSFHSLESATTPAEVGEPDVSRAEYVAGAVAAAWCKHDLSVREHRCKEAATMIRTLARQLAEAKDQASKWKSLSDAAQLGLSVQHKREVRLETALAATTRRVAEVEAERDELRQAAHGLRFDVFGLTTNELQATFDGKQSIAVVDMDTVAALKSALQKEPK